MFVDEQMRNAFEGRFHRLGVARVLPQSPQKNIPIPLGQCQSQDLPVKAWTTLLDGSPSASPQFDEQGEQRDWS